MLDASPIRAKFVEGIFWPLRKEHSSLTRKTILAYDIIFQPCGKCGEKSDLIFLHNGKNEFVFCAVSGAAKPYIVYPNETDPDNPTSVEEAAQNLLEALELAKPNPDDPDELIVTADHMAGKSKHYYGAFVENLEEAISLVEAWSKIPVKDWPKEYNQPL